MTPQNAQFIAADVEPESAPLFSREFELDAGHGGVEFAQLSLSALGVCEARINGVAVSDDLLTPGWTSYEWRLHFVEYDVTSHLDQQSTLEVLVGNGWYRGRLGWMALPRYGDDLAAFAELRIHFADGHEQVVATDESWTVAPSAILFNDLYDGQVIDARARKERRINLGSRDLERSTVHVLDVQLDQFDRDPAPPVRRVAELTPKELWRTSSGTVMVDFGENIVGFIRLRVRGHRGARITVRHAEVLDGNELAIKPLRSAKATDEYILSGGDDSFEPTFTFHGFRYAEITGWPGDLDHIADSIDGVVISSDMRRIGRFECSVPELNQFHANVVRSMRGNFVDLPMDCPQRDERLGWTGDIAAFAPTAAFLFDVQDFLVDWLQDLALEQKHHGGVVPYTVPDVLKHAVDGVPWAGSQETAAFWSDAAVWVPWTLWENYGDHRVLQATFESMLAHGRRVQSLLSPSGAWDTGFQFGDWLDPDAPAGHPAEGKADAGVVATACAYRTAVRICATATILGRTAEAEEFHENAHRLRDAFQREYVRERSIKSDCTTVYALAIAFGLLDAPQGVWAGDRLAELVRERGFHVSTGFAGTPFIADALSSSGHVAEAYQLLLQRDPPSWLYPVTMGATTIWERWDSILPDGSIHPGEMTSFNHYALGAVADWMHRVVGGLAPMEPGYRRVLIAPRIGDGVDWANTSLDTPLGVVSVRWQRRGPSVRLRVVIPDGSSGVIQWPGQPDQDLGPGRHAVLLPAPADIPTAAVGSTDPAALDSRSRSGESWPREAAQE